MLKEQIIKLLDQFAQEEMGNRLSQFSMMSLRGMIANIIDQHLAELNKQTKAVEGKAPKEEKKDGKETTKEDEAKS